MGELVIVFLFSLVLLVFNFSDIGYINRLLSTGQKTNTKKINAEKIRKILYIPYYGQRITYNPGNPILEEKKFDGTVYKITLILALINHLFILLAITGFVISLITDIIWFAVVSAGLGGIYMLVVTIIRNHIEIRCNI